MIRARRIGIVLSGTATFVHEQANTAVSCSMLRGQRSAVAAASVPGGCGELELALVFADGSMCGGADPAYAAHEMPIVQWAEGLLAVLATKGCS